MQAVIRTRRGALWPQQRQVDLGEDPVGLGQRLRRGVVGQRCPRCRRGVVTNRGIVVVGTEPAAQPPLALAEPAARDDGIDVQLVDGARETIPGAGVGSGPFGQQNDHHRGVVVIVTDERHPGRRSGQPRVQPEVADLRWVGGQQRRQTQRLAGSRFAHLIPSLQPDRASPLCRNSPTCADPRPWPARSHRNAGFTRYRGRRLR